MSSFVRSCTSILLIDWFLSFFLTRHLIIGYITNGSREDRKVAVRSSNRHLHDMTTIIVGGGFFTTFRRSNEEIGRAGTAKMRPADNQWADKALLTWDIPRRYDRCFHWERLSWISLLDWSAKCRRSLLHFPYFSARHHRVSPMTDVYQTRRDVEKGDEKKQN